MSDYAFPPQATVSLGKDPASASWAGSHFLSVTARGLKAEGGGGVGVEGQQSRKLGLSFG